MENNANPQFIVKLNYQYLVDMVNLDHYCFDREKFNDQEILKAFNCHKGTRTAIDLLGSILKNIEHSLEITLFDGKDNYPLKGEIIYQENDCTVYDDDGLENIDTSLVIHKIRPAIMKEAKDTIKYYKEYFTRLYDRSRTV